MTNYQLYTTRPQMTMIEHD